MRCFGREKESKRCAHCGEVVGEDARSLLFYGIVMDVCDLQCQRRFVGEYFARLDEKDPKIAERKTNAR